MKKALKRSISSLSVLLLLCGCGNGCGGKKPKEPLAIIETKPLSRMVVPRPDLPTTKCPGSDGRFVACVTIPADVYYALLDEIELQAIDITACCIQLGGKESDCIK